MARARQHELLRLAQIGDLELFKNFVSGHLIDQCWCNISNKKSGDNALVLAVRNGHLDLMKHLFENCGFDLEYANFDGKRPLHEAAQNGHLSCVRYLVSKKVHVDSLKRADWTPLMLACTKCNLTIVKELIQSGADPSLKNKDGWTPFHISCRTGDISVVKFLLKCDHSLWDTVSKNGRTPLHTAALHGNLETVLVLLDQGNYNTDKGDSCGTTPFMDAIRAEYVPVAELLHQKHKASVNAEDVLGRQALHLAAQAGSEQSIHYLVQQHNVDVNVQSTVSGTAPLHVACKEGQDRVVSLLLGPLGADVNVQDQKGRTALHIASGSQHLECVRKLVSHGAKDCKDDSGNTARSLAVTQPIKDFFDDAFVAFTQ